MLSKRIPRRWWLEDPIERKVLFLVLMLILMAVTFIGTETIRQTATRGMQTELENQSAKRNLGKIILRNLLLIEKDVIMLSAVRDERDVDVIYHFIQGAAGEIKKILTILQNGGTYANILPMNFRELDEIIESIAFSPPHRSQYVMEVIDLTPKIIDIESRANDLRRAVSEKLHTHPSPRALIDQIAVIRKQMDATIIRSRETANKINYETSLQINSLEAAIVDVGRRFTLFRNTVSVIAFLIGLFVCVRTLGQIRSIVAERSEYARKLGEANETINQIVEALPVGIAVINPDSTILKINRLALKMLEAESIDQVIGQSCRELFCSAKLKDCPFISGNCHKISGETEMITRSGKKMPVIKRAIHLRLNNSDVILEAFVDISDRVKAEHELIEKQDYINTILESTMVGIVVVDAEQHRIVEANPAAMALMGVSKSDIIGSVCHEWMCTSENGCCPITDQGNTVHQVECVIQSADGQEIPIIKNASLTILNGRRHLIESFFNIAPLKEAEARVRRLNEELEQRVIERTNELQMRNDELKTALMELKNTQARLLQSEKMASIGQLAAGVAHEINNPVGYVKSNLSAIDDYRIDMLKLIAAYETLREEAGRHPVAGSEFAGSIHAITELRGEIDIDFIQDDFASVLKESVEGMQRVANIVADLKNFAHMDGDTLEPAGVNEIIESTLNIVWNELKYKAEVIKELGHLPSIPCYPQRLGQVFMNLLVNAGQAIEKKGTIHITTRAEENHVMVRIADTGCGISEKHLTKIYDPFFTTKKVGEGTGLGLNVVYNIVKSHQGSVDVESHPGKGTVFTILLPMDCYPEDAPSVADQTNETSPVLSAL